MADETNLLRLTVDGELVAEASLIVHDKAKAWMAFTACFSSFSASVVGDFFEAMRIVCMAEGAKGVDTGLTVNVDTPAKAPQMNGSH